MKIYDESIVKLAFHHFYFRGSFTKKDPLFRPFVRPERDTILTRFWTSPCVFIFPNHPQPLLAHVAVLFARFVAKQSSLVDLSEQGLDSLEGARREFVGFFQLSSSNHFDRVRLAKLVLPRLFSSAYSTEFVCPRSFGHVLRILFFESDLHLVCIWCAYSLHLACISVAFRVGL